MSPPPRLRNELLERDLKRSISEQLSAIIGREGVPMAELARQTGLGRTTLYRLLWEGTELPIPSLIVLADALGYDVELKLRRRK